jgi:CHAT domain-containing protein
VVENKIFIWIISRSAIKSVDVQISQADLNARIKEYLDKVSRPPGRDDQGWREKSKELYDILIRPIENLLDRQKQLCIVPDKVLNRLPFSTLNSRVGGKLLGEEFRLLHAPSASIFLNATENVRRKSAVRLDNEKLCAVGNPAYFESDFPQLPRLPSAEREARTIARYYRSASPMLLVNSQARKNVVLREMVRADVLHLALHYQADSWTPMLSRMPMASTVPGDPNQALQMYELYQLKSRQPRLVILSACRTLAEEYMGGEGAIGVSRPFVAAGIPLIVASLWPVDSDATSELMIAFHRARKVSRLATVDALRKAQLQLFRRDDKYCHPYYWAAFITVGGFSKNF